MVAVMVKTHVCVFSMFFSSEIWVRWCLFTNHFYYSSHLWQICGVSPQGTFPSGLDSVRGTRHHGLVERVHRDRNRINSPHRRPIDKHGRQISFKFTSVKTFVEENVICEGLMLVDASLLWAHYVSCVIHVDLCSCGQLFLRLQAVWWSFMYWYSHCCTVGVNEWVTAITCCFLPAHVCFFFFLREPFRDLNISTLVPSLVGD